MTKHKVMQLFQYALLSLIWFAIGWTTHGYLGDPAVRLAPEAQRVLQAGQLILQRYYSDHALTGDELANAAIRGMLHYTQDRYAGLLVGAVNQRYQADLFGETGGPGIGLKVADGKIMVRNVRPNTPAAAAGLQADDVIVAVDGITFDAMTKGEEAATLLRGPIGQSVLVTLQRGSERFSQVLPRVEREKLTVRLLDPQIGYLKLPGFTAGSAEQVKAALAALQRSGMKSLIWDLRGNPGGSVLDAEAILNLFINDGTLFTVELRGGLHQVMQAKGAAPYADLPLVLLVDGDTYSSAEIVTAAILDHQRGLVIGAKTGGKGIIQDTVALDPQSSLHLTIARWLSPAGHWIHKQGIQPAVKMVDDPATAADETLDLARQRLTVNG